MEKVNYCTDCGRHYMGLQICPYCLSDNFVIMRASEKLEPDWYGIWKKYSNKEE